MSWWSDIAGVLLDITGVLIETDADGVPREVPGSVHAVNRLVSGGFPVRFVTNETQQSVKDIKLKLESLGFTLQEQHIFSPAPAAVKYLQENKLRPHLLVHKELLCDFSGLDQSDANCVVLGDCTHEFTYNNLNSAFRKLMSMQKPKLFSLGAGKYYSECGELTLDVGPFTAALEYACDVKAQVIGKPNKDFFLTAAKDININPKQIVMVGDDIVGDVGGAQSCDMIGVLVSTGKYRANYCDNHPTVKPHDIVDNLKHAVDKILS